MNENLDLTEILRNCPKGTKLYSPLLGEVKFIEITQHSVYPVSVESSDSFPFFMRDGKYYDYEDAECMLFPSKDNRDWSTFRVPKSEPEHHFKPFDRVLVRDDVEEKWRPLFYSHSDGQRHVCIGGTWHIMCIPYEGNESLLGTTVKPKVKEE